ncbi:hypothetical protein L1887_22398 [Cichorium endivia]|nr:hypothetical protein L1887_22398 [Cichorium endivia]
MGLSAGGTHAVYFSIYEMCKETFSRHHPNNLVAHAVAGVFATVASDAVFTLMDMVKQRLQLGSGITKITLVDMVKQKNKKESKFYNVVCNLHHVVPCKKINITYLFDHLAMNIMKFLSIHKVNHQLEYKELITDESNEDMIQFMKLITNESTN